MDVSGQNVSVPNVRPVLSNRFGDVYPDRVTLAVKKSLFAGSTRTDVALRHVSVVKVDVHRSIVLGIVCLLLFPLIITIPIGIMLLWGTPSVVVSAGGGDLPSAGPPWAKREAEDFASAVRKQIFKEG
jgi:hypothetical protein